MLEADSGSSGSGDESDELGATLAGVHKVAWGGSKYRKLITTLKIKGKNIDFEVDTELSQDWLYQLRLNWPKMLNQRDVGDPQVHTLHSATWMNKFP